MFDDWSVDVDQDDGEPAGHVNRTWPALPSERHRQVLELLHANSRTDAAGRRVSWWPQEKLAAKLGMSSRHLRRILADLREPGLDPRHPRGQPPGLRLALVKVEPTRYRDQATGRHRLGGNVYVLLEPRQQDMAQGTVSAGAVNRTPDPMSCLHKGENHTPVREEVPLAALEVGRQQPLQRRDYDPTRGEVLGALEAAWARSRSWPSGPTTSRPATRPTQPPAVAYWSWPARWRTSTAPSTSSTVTPAWIAAASPAIRADATPGGTVPEDDDYPYEVCPVCGVPLEDHDDFWCPDDGA
jgi:hypothetical protein